MVQKLQIFSILSFSILLLSGCGSNFEEKQACEKYIPQIESDMRNSEKEYPYISEFDKASFSINEIFYSPKYDTCLVDVYNHYPLGETINERVLIDVLTREQIIRYFEMVGYPNEFETMNFIDENGSIKSGELKEYEKKIEDLK